jgi:hypothetical protein
VQFREPRELVDLDRELQRALNAQGWGVGTYFNVQFLTHDRTTLLACAPFVVTEEAEALHTADEGYRTVTTTRARRAAQRIGQWQTFGEDAEASESSPGRVQWNLGARAYQVFVGDRMIFETPDKVQAREAAERGQAPTAAA